MTTQTQRFVIIATPRSGSNWLCTLLDSHPEILCHHELFNPDGIHLAWSLRGTDFELGSLKQRQDSPLVVLNRAWLETLGHSSVGFKINRGQSETVFSAVLNDPTIAKILVSRRNRIRTYVSEKIAEASGQWESFPDSSPATSVERIHIDAETLVAHARLNHRYLEDIRRQLAGSGQKMMEVCYEQIGEKKCQREILEFLGVDENIALVGRTRRMNPQPLAELVGNFPELVERLRNTELAPDISQELAHEKT